AEATNESIFHSADLSLYFHGPVKRAMTLAKGSTNGSALPVRSGVVVPNCLRAKFRNERAVCGTLGVGYSRSQRHRTDLRGNRNIAHHDRGRRHRNDQSKLRLSGIDKLDVDLCQQLGVKQRAVLGAAAVINSKTDAKIVQTVRAAGIFTPRQEQRVD